MPIILPTIKNFSSPARYKQVYRKPPRGVEPLTYALRMRCSAGLSYGGTLGDCLARYIIQYKLIDLPLPDFFDMLPGNADQKKTCNHVQVFHYKLNCVNLALSTFGNSFVFFLTCLAVYA